MATAQNAPAPSATTTLESIHRGLRAELEDRRRRLARVAQHAGAHDVAHLLDEVDTALLRLEQGTLGICEACHQQVEPEALLADPLCRFCLEHLPPEQQRALEADLELAAQLQARLLPEKTFRAEGWHAAYEYRPHGIVSGDYCDLMVCPQTRNLYFALGDVSGKGVAASMLMANLSAMFRSLSMITDSLPELMGHANRVFCQSTLPNQYATLVLGKASPDGRVEICNAGHLEPLLIHGSGATAIDGASAPIGLFRGESFRATSVPLAPGDTLVLFSDGITEAADAEKEFGVARLAEACARHAMAGAPEQVIAAIMRDLARFQNGTPRNDDQAIMLLQRGQ